MNLISERITQLKSIEDRIREEFQEVQTEQETLENSLDEGMNVAISGGIEEIVKETE